MHKKISAFSRNVWLTVALFIALAVTFVFYVFAEKQIDHANDVRYQSLLLVDELRQSSDYLTYMARSFIVNGDPLYKKYYQDVLDIRDGKKPRSSLNSINNIYWGLASEKKQLISSVDSSTMPLLDMIRQIGVSEKEFEKLAQAKTNSDLLTITELRAMSLVESAGSDLAGKRAAAFGLLFGEQYNLAKAAIWKPLNEFYQLMDARTLDNVKSAETLASRVRWILIGFGLSLMFMLWRASQTLRTTLGANLETIHKHIANIGSGNFSSSSVVDVPAKNSVLGWLVQTQNDLIAAHNLHEKMEASLRESEARYRQIVVTAEEGIWAVDADANTSFVNPKMAVMLGYTEDEMLGRPLSDFMDDVGKEITEKNLERRRQGISEQHDFKFLHKDGSERWCRLATSPIFDENNHYAGALAMVTDITARRQTESALQEAYLYTQAILDNMADGVITFNKQGDIESFNASAHTMFGYEFDEIVAANLSLLIVETHNLQVCRDLAHMIESETKQLDMEGKRKDGSVFPINLSVSLLSRSGRESYVGVIRDTTRERQHIEEVHRLAFFDPLTELPNRRLVLDRLAQAILSASRTGQHGALMFLDLDHFKQLNDTLGHDVGDELLQQVGARLQSCVRDCDTVARMGGDEFVVLLEALSTHPIDAAAQTKAVANKILQVLGQPYHLCEHSYVSTPSIGIVVFLDQIESTEELCKKADVAMYQAKAVGRNTIRFFDPAMQAALSIRVEMESNMRRALGKNEFILHYQIQVDSQGIATGVEALLRWNHSVHGIVSPAAFIPMAEETGMILPIGKWVLEAACKQLAEWAEQPAMAHWTMAVNVSASQFARSDFVAILTQILHSTGAKPELLKLELTEAMLVSDIDDVIFKMAALKELGVCFSLDDFGTGYSSLAYLKRLPLDQLKIDKSFVHDLVTNTNDEAIARSVVTLGHNLGFKVIAEGVETAEQQNFLEQMGCDAYQGYYFGYPVATADLQSIVNNIPQLH